MCYDEIPNELKSDHLFLLIGGNPLPNWVAVRLLLKEKGQVYLVHTQRTQKLAQNFSDYLLGKGLEKQPKYIDLTDQSDPRHIYDKVRDSVEKIQSGQIGLNYTGGTKAMSVQSYRAVEKEILNGIPTPIFSYLDADTLKMRFDNGSGYSIGLNPKIRLKISELMALHLPGKKAKISTKPVAISVAESIINLHTTSYEKWKEWKRRLRNIKPETDTFEWKEPLNCVAKTIIQDVSPTITISDFFNKNKIPFDSWGKLKHFMEGQWLESYIVDIIKRNQDFIDIYDHGWNIENKEKKEIRFEGDVIAIRGYQCHFISCTSSDNKGTCKLKLMEVFVRASQIGGDEARVALVCAYDSPGALENEVKGLFRAQGRVKVFGRKDFENLEKGLIGWFNKK